MRAGLDDLGHHHTCIGTSDEKLMTGLASAFPHISPPSAHCAWTLPWGGGSRLDDLVI